MINQDNIQVRVVSGGIYLSVKTDKSEQDNANAGNIG